MHAKECISVGHYYQVPTQARQEATRMHRAVSTTSQR